MSNPTLACPHCGTANQIRSGWCRSCGKKLVFAQDLIDATVQETARVDRDELFRRQSLAWCGLAVAIFLVAAVARIAMAPDLPPLMTPVLPAPQPPEGVLRQAPPPPANRPLSDGVRVAAPVALGATSAVVSGSLLDWRIAHTASVLSGCSLPTDILQVRLGRILENQRADGSWPTPEATALAVVACQAYPNQPIVRDAAQRGRAWLMAQTGAWRMWSPAARSQAFLALAEAGLTSEEHRKMFGPLVVDGSAPLWQSLYVATCSANQLPADWISLAHNPSLPRAALLGLASRRLGKSAEIPLVDPSPTGLDADNLIAWAVSAWAAGVNPAAVVATLRLWIKDGLLGAPAPVLDALTVIAGAVPGRYPTTWWQRP